MKLVKLPGFLFNAEEAEQHERLGLAGEPEMRPFDFYVNPEHVAALMPANKNPDTETAVWLTVGDNFLCSLPIGQVAQLLTQSKAMAKPEQIEYGPVTAGEINEWRERILNTAYHPDAK